MIETDSHGQPLEVDDLDADWLLELRPRGRGGGPQGRERRRLRVVLRWCDLNPRGRRREPALGGVSRSGSGTATARIGGDGVPRRSRSSPPRTLAAVMRMSPAATTALDGRGARAAAPAAAGSTPASSPSTSPCGARGGSRRPPQDLSPEAAAHVDAVPGTGRGLRRAPPASTGPSPRRSRLHDPASLADRRGEGRHHRWGITLRHASRHRRRGGQWAGTSWLSIIGDTPTLQRLHDLITDTTAPPASPDRARTTMRDLGVRQIQALGRRPRRPRRTPAPGPAQHRRQPRRPHHQPPTPLTPVGCGSGPRPRPRHASRRSALAHRRLRSPCSRSSTWPAPTPSTTTTRPGGCATSSPAATPTASSRSATPPPPRCDLDHITPYLPLHLGGPPGQTHPGNLAPLCRHHHRRQDPPSTGPTSAPTHGDYLWRDQHRHGYAVTALGTLGLDGR